MRTKKEPKYGRMTEEGIRLIADNSKLPAGERMTVSQIAKLLKVSTQTVNLVKKKIGLTCSKPSDLIGNDIESIKSFLHEYDTTEFGCHKNMLDKYGFLNINSMRTRVSQLRKKINSNDSNNLKQ